MKRLGHQLVALNQLGRRKTHGNVRRRGMVLDKVGNAVNTAMQRTAVWTVGRTKVQRPGRSRNRATQGVVHQLADALVAGSANGDNGHAQQARAG